MKDKLLNSQPEIDLQRLITLTQKKKQTTLKDNPKLEHQTLLSYPIQFTSPQKYTKVMTIGTIKKDHFSYGKALFQYFRKNLRIPAETTITKIQQPVESDPEEYKNRFNNLTTAQDKSMVNKKPRFLFPITSSYHQTPQSRIVFNPLLKTHWTKLLREYRSLFGNFTPTAGQIEGNLSTWKQPPAQNPAELAFLLIEETAILQPIGSSDKGKQPALALKEHSNTWTPILLTIISNTSPINWLMTYQDITKLEKIFETVTFTHDFESTEQEVNHTQAVNLAINETSDINTKITQLSEKLTQKIEKFLVRTTKTYQPPQWRENNNNSRYPQQQNH
ncbi:hypothetical protein G9A89_016111 [Geosiphon pyriformis]|nr:hypothetical protein G9A89_016111 [Geosiphon pyriformis]